MYKNIDRQRGMLWDGLESGFTTTTNWQAHINKLQGAYYHLLKLSDVDLNNKNDIAMLCGFMIHQES